MCENCGQSGAERMHLRVRVMGRWELHAQERTNTLLQSHQSLTHVQ